MSPTQLNLGRNFQPTIEVFAYGSNLDEDQMLRRCPGSWPTYSATLPAHRLAFAGRGTYRSGGVATVVSDPSSSVSGMVYEVPASDLARLDRCEGHPHVYERQTLPVLDVSGSVRMVEVYIRSAVPVAAPGDEYLGIIREAYRRLGFDEADLDEAARGETEESFAGDLEDDEGRTLVFVYGSLLSGLSNHDVLSRNGSAVFVRADRTPPFYTMVDLGSFPGVFQCGSTKIVGEVWSVDRECLAALDRLEGHPHFYKRCPVSLVGTRQAVTYFLQRSGRMYGRSMVSSGDWRSRIEGKGTRWNR